MDTLPARRRWPARLSEEMEMKMGGLAAAVGNNKTAEKAGGDAQRDQRWMPQVDMTPVQ